MNGRNEPTVFIPVVIRIGRWFLYKHLLLQTWPYMIQVGCRMKMMNPNDSPRTQDDSASDG